MQLHSSHGRCAGSDGRYDAVCAGSVVRKEPRLMTNIAAAREYFRINDMTMVDLLDCTTRKHRTDNREIAARFWVIKTDLIASFSGRVGLGPDLECQQRSEERRVGDGESDGV